MLGAGTRVHAAYLSAQSDLMLALLSRAARRLADVPLVVVSAEEWERRSKRTGNLAEFFAGSPLRGSQIDVRRRKDRPRKVDV